MGEGIRRRVAAVPTVRVWLRNYANRGNHNLYIVKYCVCFKAIHETTTHSMKTKHVLSIDRKYRVS